MVRPAVGGPLVSLLPPVISSSVLLQGSDFLFQARGMMAPPDELNQIKRLARAIELQVIAQQVQRKSNQVSPRGVAMGGITTSGGSGSGASSVSDGCANVCF